MKNMLLAYFNTSEQKRPEVVALLGHILNFTEEEIKKVGTGSHPPQATGWFSGLLSSSGASQSQQQHDKVCSLNSSADISDGTLVFYFFLLLSFSTQPLIICVFLQTFSELFVNFLEKESESQLLSQSSSQAPGMQSSGTRTTSTRVTTIPARLRDSPLPMSPLGSSTPLGNEGSAVPVSTPVVTNPMMMNVRPMESVPGGSHGAG
jgi:hypothetical protein